MEFYQNLPLSQQNILQAAQNLAVTCHYDSEHFYTVTKYSLNIFDALSPIHKMGEPERTWLMLGAFLHDIGWVEGKKGHHKKSLEIILKSSLLPLENKERLIVGNIARYHRKTLPSLSHEHFVVLEPPERNTVTALASMLRLADGLDHLGDRKTRDLFIEVTPQKVIITCKSLALPDVQKKHTDKADLFEIVFKRRLSIKWAVLV